MKDGGSLFSHFSSTSSSFEQFGIRINWEVIQKFIVVRDKLFALLGLQKYRKPRYKILNVLRKSLKKNQNFFNFSIKFLDFEISLLKSSEIEELKENLENYFQLRDGAARELYKIVEEFGMLWHLGKNYGVSQDDVRDSLHNCILKILDKIQITPFTVLYVKKWLQTQLKRDLEKKNKIQFIPFSLLESAQNEKGVLEEDVMRTLYHSVDQTDEWFCTNGFYALSAEEILTKEEANHEVEDNDEENLFQKIFEGHFLSAIKDWMK